MLYVIPLVLIYNWEFAPFDHLHPISPFLTPHSSTFGNHKYELFFYKAVWFLSIINLLIIDMQMTPCLWQKAKRN